ncbi:MAG: VWA domain-containing protein [Saprospiraceae bacterium]|nr:VWA domain-containing protein [Saprospiraceae bacterium]
MKKLLLFCFVIFSTLGIEGQKQSSPILFIYDASGSMWGKLEASTKKDIAANVLSSTVEKIPADKPIGLIAYGHRSKSDCNDIELIADISNNSKTKIITAVKGLKSLGKTPLAKSATLAIGLLRESKIKTTIILITDGIESCEGDLCSVIKKAKSENIDFRLHIVGFGLKETEKEALICAAKAGDGYYYDADNTTGLQTVLSEATAKTVDEPKANFSVFATKTGKPVDAIIRARNSQTKKEVAWARTYRDTGFVYLAKGKYEIEVRALEGTDIPATSFTLDMNTDSTRHRNISFDGGILEVTTTNNGKPWDVLVKMMDKKSGKIMASTRTYGRTKQMEVPAGHYKVSFQALGIEGLHVLMEIEDVWVKSNGTTPVTQNFESGIAFIEVSTKTNELIDATVNVHDKASGKNVATDRTYTSSTTNPSKFVLNPGTYDVHIKTLGKHKGHSGSYTIVVKAGETTEKSIKY